LRIAQSYIDSAVATLTRLDARHNWATDLYPIVTLADRHIRALLARGLRDQALEIARRYFERVKERRRQTNAPILEQLFANLLKFTTTGVWVPTEYEQFVHI
jgi:hypothetical protein